MDSFENFIDVYRKQRHDFMNNVQVIYGYLQLDKNEEAIEYIKKVVEENKNLSKLYALGDKNLAFSLETNLKNLWLKETLVEIDIEINSLSKEVFSNQYNKKSNIVNNIFKELENNKCKFVYIYFFQDELGESLLIGNSESCANEIDWMEDWEEIEIDLKDMLLNKYIENGKLAYRLTFQ